MAIKNIVKHPILSNAISDVAWSKFVSQLDYKPPGMAGTLVKMDMWYPPRKRGVECEHVLDSFPLEIRSWTRPAYGVQHDRDVNAAKNMVATGQAVLAYGESIRPGAVKTKPGKPQRSRKPTR